MEHETSLWTDPYHDEKYGEEKGASFKYFKEFIKMPSPRTLVGFHEELSRKLSRQGKKRIPSYKTLSEYSSAWKWFMRAEAYDNWKRDVDDEALKNEIRQIREDAIRGMKDRINYQNKLREEIESNDLMSTNQKVYGASKNSEALRNEIASFNELVNEGQTNINMDASLDAEIETNENITVDERNSRNEDYIREFVEGTKNTDDGKD